jgi:hypothetical protein
VPWIRVESSVARNKKFVKAGPAPSWLWLCGLCYCQEGLTDGFIPREALPYLGTKNAPQLAAFLVKAGLWDEVEGGWQVHDYLSHNRSAAEVAELKDRRGSGGKLGGRPRKNLHENLPVTTKVLGSETSGETFTVAVVADASVAAAVPKKGEVFAMDVAARELLALAPPGAQCKPLLVERPLWSALHEIASERGLSLRESWEFVKARLENHKQSHQWQVKGYVKRLDRWLEEGVYRAELPAEAPSDRPQAKSKPTWYKPAGQAS